LCRAAPADTVHAAEVKHPTTGTGQPASILGSIVAGTSPATSNLTTSDIVRIVSELTEDIARFDSVISSERRELERRRSNLAPGQLREDSERINKSAAAILERARGALAELRNLSEGQLRA
jgi:hypothetical protein